MNNTQHVARTQIRPAGKNRTNRSEVANKKQIAESCENPAIRKKNENETKKQKVNTDIPDSKKLSRKEIQFSNSVVDLLKHWNNRIAQLNSSKMRKHKLEGSKLIENTKITLRKLIGFGADFAQFRCAIDIYFDFLEKRYKHKVFVGLYVSIDNFFKFSNFTKGKIDDSKSPIKGESSWYSIIAETPGTNCERLTGLLAKYGGEIKDANPELSKAFLDLFCRKTDRPKESITPTEKAHFIKAGEYLAEFIEKYEKRIVWKNIMNGTKINVAVPFFNLLNFDYQSPSYFLIAKSNWEKFKPYLEQNGYLR